MYPMREYLGLDSGGLVHMFERSWTTHGIGDIGLCDDAQRLMHTRVGDCPLTDYVPTCLECIAREARARRRQ